MASYSTVPHTTHQWLDRISHAQRPDITPHTRCINVTTNDTHNPTGRTLLPLFQLLHQLFPPHSQSFLLSFVVLSVSELSYRTFVEETRGKAWVCWTTRPHRTWKQPPHLVCIIGTQIFETSFFVFQTIDCLIYELALEFHCRKATDEKITENERFAWGEKKLF